MLSIEYLRHIASQRTEDEEFMQRQSMFFETYYFSDEVTICLNCHWRTEDHTQQHTKINAWGGKINDTFIVPYYTSLYQHETPIILTYQMILSSYNKMVHFRIMNMTFPRF